MATDNSWPWSAAFVASAVATLILLTSCGEKSQPAQVHAPGIGPPIAPTVTAAPDPRIVYELREKCGADAQAWYHHYFEETNMRKADGVNLINIGFTSHYSERLNRCFAVVTSTTSLRDAKSKAVKFGTSSTLTDVLENKDFGQFYKFSDMPNPMACNVNERKCDSQETFDGLTASFMKDD